MMETIGLMTHNLIILVGGGFIRCFPLRNRLRVSPQRLLLLYGLLFFLQSAALVLVRDHWPSGYLGGVSFQASTGVVIMLLPFVLTKKSFFQNLFLLALMANFCMVVIGAGNYAELALGGSLAVRYPFLLSNLVKLLLSVLLIPLILKMLEDMFSLQAEDGLLIWRFIWIIPTLFALLCFMAGSFLTGEASVISALFIFGRVLVGIGCVATCALLARAFRQETENAAMSEKARMTEGLLALQREQYEQLTERVNEARAARHDLRHQLAVLKDYVTCEQYQRLSAYLDELMAAAPPPLENQLCENNAVNAVAGHYLSMAQQEGVEISAALYIPTHTGQVSQSDLCVLVGNLLENAVEACRTAAGDRRFIKLAATLQGERLYLTVDNSFDGQVKRDGAAYLSRKREEPGVGLDSVRAVCEKYGGEARFETEAGVWRASVLLQTVPKKIEKPHRPRQGYFR